MNKPKSFNQKKKELRSKFKFIKAGAKKLTDYSEEDQKLLKKYYGC